MMLFEGERQPVTILADVVAKVIAERWKKLKKARFTLGSAQHPFAVLAYEYLTRRERGTYKLERENAPHSAHDRWTSERSETSSTVGNIFIAVLSAFLALGAIAGVTALATHLPQLIVQLMALLRDPQFYLMLSLWAVAMSIAVIASRFLAHPAIEAFAGDVFLDWRLYQPLSSAELRSERQIILHMARSDNFDIPHSSPVSDSDIEEADESPVPVPPGIAEIVLSIDKDALTQIEAELTALRTQQLSVFWGSFALFALCLLGSLGGGLFLGTKTALLGGTAVCTVIASYSVYALRNARRSAIAIALFRSYLAELRGRLSYLATLKSEPRREELRVEAWTAFRAGINRLWLLEGKSKKP